MEDELPPPEDGTERREPAQIPPLPPEIASEREEVQKLVDAGAGSPEELRALAARLREQREREESAWRREVRPALIQAKKSRRGPLLRSSSEREAPSQLAVAVGVAAAVLALLFVATLTSFWVLLLGVVGVLAYAYVQGREP